MLDKIKNSKFCKYFKRYGCATKVDGIKEIYLSTKPYPCISEEDEILDKICSIERNKTT